MATRAGNTLRSITFRLSAASPTQLPHLVQPIATALLDCKSLLSTAPAPNNSKEASDALALHKFKTQLSSLINGKTPEARFAATVLIKTSVELGGWEILQSTGGVWVRALLTNLGKQDPPAVRQLVVITLARIFLLTQEYPSLIREITTPSLPAFVTTCLGIITPKTATSTPHQLKAQSQLLVPVLESFQLLLPHHPTIFRSYISQLKSLLLPLLAPTPSSTTTSTPVSNDPAIIHAAQTLFVLLPFCAPKSGSSDDWNSSISAIIQDNHETCNKVFRSVLEDWQSVAGVQMSSSSSNGAQNITMTDLVSQSSPSMAGLPTWTGIHAGCERLTGLLGLLQTFTTTQTASSITFPLGRIVDLIRRITSVTVPRTHNGATGEGLRFNNQISKEERDALFAELPGIHVAAVALVEALCVRFGSVILPVLITLVEHVVWVFRYENYNDMLRGQCYVTCAKVVEIAGSGMSKEQVSGLDEVIKMACYDILPASDGPKKDAQPNGNRATAAGPKTDKHPSINADSFLPSSSKPHTAEPTTPQTPLSISAHHLLTTPLLKIPSQLISQSLRSLLDRTAILSNHKSAMLASVLNPPHSAAAAKVHSSILPLLARAYPESLEVEAVLRPRMPVVMGRYEDDVNEEDERDGEDELATGWMPPMIDDPFQQSLPDAAKPGQDGSLTNESLDSQETRAVRRPESGVPLKPQPAVSLINVESTSQLKRTAPDADGNESKKSRLATTEIPAFTAADGNDPSGIPGLPLPAPKTTSQDPVVQKLAQNASSNPELKALMKTVAAGDATGEQLRVFQGHINQIEDRKDDQSQPGNNLGITPQIPVLVEEQGRSVAMTTVSVPAREVPTMDLSSDDDDFVIPDINMEPDTEDEDEDEEDEDEDEEDEAEDEEGDADELGEA